MMLDHVSGISGKRDLDGDVWIVSEGFNGIEITRACLKTRNSSIFVSAHLVTRPDHIT